MLFKLKGYISMIYKDYVILDVNYISFKVNLGTTKKYEVSKNKEVMFFLVEVIKEDTYDLIGFNTLEEKEMYLNLVKVQGIGPKIATNILSKVNLTILKAAILNKDLNFLRSLPQVGSKMAEQIIIDLAKRITLDNELSLSNNYQKMNEVSKVLHSFGYSTKDYGDMLLNYNHYDLETGEIVKDIMKELAIIYGN